MNSKKVNDYYIKTWIPCADYPQDTSRKITFKNHQVEIIPITSPFHTGLTLKSTLFQSGIASLIIWTRGGDVYDFYDETPNGLKASYPGSTWDDIYDLMKALL